MEGGAREGIRAAKEVLGEPAYGVNSNTVPACAGPSTVVVP
jgi:hypothetical protein